MFYKQNTYWYIYMSCKEYICFVYLHTAITRRSERNFDLYGKGLPWGTIWAQHGPHGGQHGRPYGAHKSIIPKASTASVFMGAHGPVSLFCCSDGRSWAWSRGVGGNIGLIPHTSYICISYIHCILSADPLGSWPCRPLSTLIHIWISIYVHRNVANGPF